MRRGILGDVGAGLLGAVFLLGLAGEAYGLHACPHHHPDAPDSPPPAAAGAAPANGPDDGSDRGPCTCVGSCHAGAAVPLPTTAPAVSPAELALEGRRPPARSEERARLRGPYFLPFPNGPPSL